METSATIGELAKALAKVQGTMESAKMDKTNPYFKSKYADLNSIFQACRKQLTENGLSISQLPGNPPAEYGTSLSLTTILMHESGEWIKNTFIMPLTKHSPQDFGSAITYARRYALASILGVVADEDDDGNHASGKNDSEKQKTKVVKDKDSFPKATDEQVKQIGELTVKLNKQQWLQEGLKANDVMYIRDLTYDQAKRCLDKLKAEDEETDKDIDM